MDLPPPAFPKHKKKVIVCGTRTFSDFALLSAKMDKIVENFWDVALVSGANKHWDTYLGEWVGADYLAERWASKRRFTIVRFWPDWDRLGKKAGPLRNAEMARYATHCVAFWDGESRGTLSMINLAKMYDLKLRIVRY